GDEAHLRERESQLVSDSGEARQPRSPAEPEQNKDGEDGDAPAAQGHACRDGGGHAGAPRIIHDSLRARTHSVANRIDINNSVNARVIATSAAVPVGTSAVMSQSAGRYATSAPRLTHARYLTSPAPMRTPSSTYTAPP